MSPSGRSKGGEADSTLERLSSEIVLHLNGGNVAQTEACCRRANALMDDLGQGHIEPDMRELLSAKYYNLGCDFQTLGCVNESETAYQRALALWSALSSADAVESFRFRGMAAACHNRMGILYETAGRLEQAGQAYRQALAIREQLNDTDPTDNQNRVYRAGTFCNLGNVASQQG